MSDPFSTLKTEINGLARTSGDRPSFWWRDDDLVAVTPQLQRLSEFAERRRVPCLLSAISARLVAKPSDWGQFGDQLHYACHGLHHKNHQWLSLFPSEFGSARSNREVAEDLGTAWTDVAAAFGPRALPVLVPPWNRFNRKHYETLAQSAFRGFSGFARGDEHNWPRGVKRIDVHLDLLDWRGNPKVLDQELIANRLRKQMRKMARSGARSPETIVIGILSHHRAMNDDAWLALEALFDVFLQNGMRAADPKTLFGL